MQRTQYYPSGLPWTDVVMSGDTYKYNGKEFVEAHGLDEYDSHARRYYPAIMRTTTLDPLAEKYYSISPYAWCDNNPVNRIDPDGENKSLSNIVIDATSSVIPGKVVDGVTSGLNKAVTSDLISKSAATMTKGTQTVLKQSQSIVNSTTVQTGANAVSSYIGGQAKESISTNFAGQTQTSLDLPTDAIKVEQPLLRIPLSQ